MAFFSKRNLRIYLPKKLAEWLPDFFEEISQFFRVFKWYLQKKLGLIGFHFEKIKGFLVDKLMWRRGRLTKPFVHTSLMFILSFGVLFGPLIASKYPTLGKEEREFDNNTPSSILNTITATSLETTTDESKKPRDKIITYTVQKGDTLSSVSKNFFGNDSELSLNTIKWENKLTADDLTIGQELSILPVPGVKHIVESGETVYSIAKTYNTNPQKIVDFPFNYFRDEETFALNIGDLLIVPDGIKPEEKPYIPPVYYAQAPSVPTAGGTGEFIWPTNGEITQFRTWYHTGIDIANPSAPDVVAAAAGVVSVVAYDTYDYGFHVVINHGQYQTLYGHLQRIDVVEGQSVSTGQVIGRMGSTGRSTGTHLHFEIRQGNDFLDPMNFLK